MYLTNVLKNSFTHIKDKRISASFSPARNIRSLVIHLQIGFTKLQVTFFNRWSVPILEVWFDKKTLDFAIITQNRWNHCVKNLEAKDGFKMLKSMCRLTLNRAWTGIQGFTRDCRGSTQGFYRGLQEYTRVYRGLQGHTKGLQGIAGV